ncbi:g4906 [Coccomyxa elongata]
MRQRGGSNSSISTVQENDRIRVRQARIEDAKAVAEVCAQAFDFEPDSFKGRDGPASWFGSFIIQTAKADVERQVVRALESKQKARKQARLLLLDRQLLDMRAELEALREGRRLRLVPKAVSRSQQEALQRRRKCACLVAEDVEQSSLVGCAFTSMVAPEALLPPPWPTTKPLRFYMSNLGVLQTHRRRGVARALLEACEVLGRRWGEDSVWLHTEADNVGANALYQAAGYNIYRTSENLYIGGSVRQGDKVFIWDTAESEKS